MDKLHNGWFSETEDCDGVAFSLGVQEILYQGKSKFQDILVFRRFVFLFEILNNFIVIFIVSCSLCHFNVHINVVINFSDIYVNAHVIVKLVI